MQHEASKADLRRVALARRAAVPEATRKAFAERLAIEGVGLARRLMAGTVATYWPIRGEADVGPLTTALAYHEFRTVLPAVVGPGRSLAFRRWKPRDPLVEGPFGTIEASTRSPEAVPDLLFVPLAAFDRRGARIGYGAGHYDRTLSGLRSARPVVAVGVAFSVQEVETVPAEPHDQRLDLILTETEMITCRME